MPRFLTLVRIDETMPDGEPPQALFDAMNKQIDADTAAGILVEAQGLAPSAQGALATLVDGKITVVDGPFTEAKEIVAGFWIIETKTREEAVEWAKRVPFQEGEVDVLQVFTTEEFAEVARDVAAKEAELRSQIEKRG